MGFSFLSSTSKVMSGLCGAADVNEEGLVNHCKIQNMGSSVKLGHEECH